MKTDRTGRGILRAFARDEGGFVLVFAGLMMLPLLGLCGLAFDLGRGWMAEVRLRQSVDAAALYAAERLDSPTAVLQTSSLLTANLAGASQGAQFQTPAIGLDAVSGTAVVSVRGSVKTTFGVLLSQSQVPLAATATAKRFGTSPAWTYKLVN